MNLITRMALESLSQKPKGLIELSNDLGLSHRTVLNLTEVLKELNFIRYENEYFHLIKKKDNSQKVSEICCEVKDLMSSLIEEMYGSKEEAVKLSLKKVWLTDSEEKILNSFFKQAESFLADILKEKRTGLTKNKRIIYWGSGSYEGALKGQMSLI